MNNVHGQTDDGCPIYGCRNTGGFQMKLDLPRGNVSIDWVSDFFLGPIPGADGCVGNSVALVCQSNGPGPADTGLVGVNKQTGTVRWRDFILRFPTLPVLDDRGDLYGTDGSNFMKYDVKGKPLISNIPIDPPLRPLFGLQTVGRDLFLMVSQTGKISLWSIFGGHMGDLTLEGTVERSNGTFIPTAPAVVNGRRFYVLTEFVPNTGQEEILGLQRLYAIDLNQTAEDAASDFEVVWYCNFQRESDMKPSATLRYKPRNLHRKLIMKMKIAVNKPVLFWDHTYTRTVFVSLPPPLLTSKETPTSVASFWGIRDTGSESDMVFHLEKAVTNMAMYQYMSEEDIQPPGGPIIVLPSTYPTLYVSLADSTLSAVDPSGTFYKPYDVPKLLHADLKITTKLTIIRRTELMPDILIFGIHVASPTDEFLSIASELGAEGLESSNKSFVVAIDTEIWFSGEEAAESAVMWMVAAPENTVVTGQIVGLPAVDRNDTSRLVAFSQVDGQFGKLFAIT